MKITKLTTYRLPPRWMFLKIETDEGIVGWGEPVIEGKAKSVEAAVHELGEFIIGQDPARINDIWQMLYRGSFYRGGPILMSAISGIDQALWDIKGKALGAPVYQLLGGLVRDKIKAYSWVGGDRPSDVIDGIKNSRRLDLIPLSSTAVKKWALLITPAKWMPRLKLWQKSEQNLAIALSLVWIFMAALMRRWQKSLLKS